MIIPSTPEHGLGEKQQQLTFRMAANAIWNKINFGLSILERAAPKSAAKDQLWEMLVEARALADSIVKHNDSGDESLIPLVERPAGITYVWVKRREREGQMAGKKVSNVKKAIQKYPVKCDHCPWTGIVAQAKIVAGKARCPKCGRSLAGNSLADKVTDTLHECVNLEDNDY